MNRGLFADHFLKERLADVPEWNAADGLNAAFSAIQKLYRERAERFAASTNEAQTEHDFVQPVLDILWEHNCYQVQVTIPNLDARRQPDYALFRAAADRDDAEARKGAIAYWRDVPALGDAKKWRVSLDKLRGADENPGAQISNYLYRSHVRWGILTNGAIWRLYERERSSAGGVFYEVDLEALLRNGDAEAFRYFYLFFRREALLPAQDGSTFLEKVFQGSVAYATQVGDRLKESVYDALRLLMNGFFEHAANGLDRRDAVTVKHVHDTSLIVLYRLLFLLYAEDRGLLPCDEELYKTYSLRDMQRTINGRLRSGGTYPAAANTIWPNLCNLVSLIDNGLDDNGRVVIPAYNGGLFSAARHPEIAADAQPGTIQWKIGDHRIAQVVDMLAYQRERWQDPGSQDIDYKSLEVQHLGSIYEGLLELQPRLATVPLVEVIEDGKLVFKPQSEVPNPRTVRGQQPRRIAADEIYLVTNRGERKATGSYYTPKYIVDYIVENTVGPLVDKAAAEVAALHPDADKEIAKLERTRRQWDTAGKQGDSDASGQIANCNQEIEKHKRRLLEPYLSLNILDPAMGSGHFLVGAADFLSLAMATDPELPALDAMSQEEPQAFYKRLVVEHCLYGVDLNPLSVELAKLSLWLHTVSKDKALSFLDHHLRCGNSLIGASLDKDLMKAPPQFNARGQRTNANDGQLVLGLYETLTANHLAYFLDTFRKIVETPTGDAQTERLKDAWYREMDQVRDKFRAVANLWLAPFFGVAVTRDFYEQAVNTLRGSQDDLQALQQKKVFRTAQEVAGERRFFHWQLEFPEVFLAPLGLKPSHTRGFDAVIGNPPYIRVRTLKEEAPIEAAYYENCGDYSSAQRVWDIYMLLIEHTKVLSRIGCTCGFIIPIQTLHQPNAESLRRWLLDNTQLLHLLDLSALNVFEEAIVKTCTLVYRFPTSPTSATESVSVEIANGAELRTAERIVVQQSDFKHHPTYSLKPSLVSENIHPIVKIDSVSDALANWCYVTFGLRSCAKGKGQGDKSRLVTSDQKEKAAVKYLEGREIGRYIARSSNRYLRYIPEEMYSPRTPALFETPKIISQSMLSAKRIVATLDEDNHYVEQSLVCTVPHGIVTPATARPVLALRFILGVMNSSLLSFYFAQKIIGDSLGGGLIHATPGSVAQLPIRRIEFTMPADKRERELEKGERLYERYVPNGSPDTILEFVAQQLGATPERADVVHDLLAFLAQQMIDLNAEKQRESKSFLTWLERRIGAQVDDLSNKTKIREYHEHDFGSLSGVLQKNLGRLQVDPAARAVEEKIESEFIESVDKMTPMKAALAATDRLIDLIVYRLYGLTDDEIAIVEGNENGGAARASYVS